MLQPENVPDPSQRDVAPFHVMVVTMLPQTHCGGPVPYDSVTFNVAGIPPAQHPVPMADDDELDEDLLLLDAQHGQPAIDDTVTGIVLLRQHVVARIPVFVITRFPPVH